MIIDMKILRNTNKSRPMHENNDVSQPTDIYAGILNDSTFVNWAR